VLDTRLAKDSGEILYTKFKNKDKLQHSKINFQVKTVYADIFGKMSGWSHLLYTLQETRKRNDLIKVPSIFDFLSIEVLHKTF